MARPTGTTHPWTTMPAGPHTMRPQRQRACGRPIVSSTLQCYMITLRGSAYSTILHACSPDVTSVMKSVDETQTCNWSLKIFSRKCKDMRLITTDNDKTGRQTSVLLPRSEHIRPIRSQLSSPKWIRRNTFELIDEEKLNIIPLSLLRRMDEHHVTQGMAFDWSEAGASIPWGE